MSDNAIELLKKIPWPKDSYHELIKNSTAVQYFKSEEIKRSRHLTTADLDEEDLELDCYLPPQMITLIIGEYDEGLTYVLKAEKGKLYCHSLGEATALTITGTIVSLWKDNGFPEPEGQTATDFFDELIRKYKDLIQIPADHKIHDESTGMVSASNHYAGANIDDEQRPGWIYGKLKQRLFDHGWPDDFDGEAFNANLTKVIEDWDNEVYEE